MDDLELAIIDSNTLTCIGLQTILENILPGATIRSFRTFGDLMDDTPFAYKHYFVSSNIYLEHVNFFREQGHKAIILAQSHDQVLRLGRPAIDVSQDEHGLIQQIIRLRQYGSTHGGERMNLHPAQYQPELSMREIEVLGLLCKGLTNREIADKLCIGLTTVITHRKNIQEKTGIKSMSGLTVYAIINGFVNADEI